VLDAIRDVLASDRLRKYPDPLGIEFRHTAGRILDVDPEGILIGNGSDDILTILTRAFVPEGGLVVSPTPSYILYGSLAEIQGARYRTVPYTPDWQLPMPWPVSGAHLTFVTSPNSPSGTTLPLPVLESLAEQLTGPLVIDEAYVEFAEENALKLSRRPNVLVSRSFSKSHSLAGIRFGFAVGDPALVRELVKVKDSYNCDALSLAAAAAALEDGAYLQSTRAKILATRNRLTAALERLGFDVTPSQANFLWCRWAGRPLRPIYEELKRRRILIRSMAYKGYGEGLRISVGTDSEVDRLLAELTGIL
jgi:histidinol-phosphate aminotransferase